MGRAYQTTEVPVAKSQEDLRKLLIKFGADQFQVGEGRDWAGVEFVHADQIVRLRCPVRPCDPATDTRHRSTAEKLSTGDEHERARIWRVLVHSVKARLVAVEEEVETFEEAFLSHIVDPVTNRTIWEQAKPAIEKGALKQGGAGLKALGSGG